MKYQFMPLFWGDFLANTMHLTAQEAGAYLFLIAHAWEHDGQIAGDDVQRVARVNNRNWHRVRPRIAPFFSISCASLSDATLWTSERVLTELTRTGEISNKRKDAAMQMHSKRNANGYANGHHTITTLPIEMLSSVREASDPTEKPIPAEPKPVAEKKPVDHRDPGLDYRSPPKTKSENVLEPIPERPAFRRP